MIDSGEQAAGLYNRYDLQLTLAPLPPSVDDPCQGCQTQCIFEGGNTSANITLKSTLRRIPGDRYYKLGLGLARTLDMSIRRFKNLTGLDLTRTSLMAIGRGEPITRDKCPHGVLYDIRQGQLALDLSAQTCAPTGQ